MGIIIGVAIGCILAILLLGVWCSLVVAGDLDREMYAKNSKKRGKNGK